MAAVTTPADRVTLTRAGLGVGCAVVVAVCWTRHLDVRSWWLVGLAAVTLFLDAVDGPVARATGTASDRGARLDMEVDAAVLVILSAAVATYLGWWVLLIGALRYVYLGAGSLFPVLGTPVPRSRFRRTVAGLQGAALGIALIPILPVTATVASVALALVLLVLSFLQQALCAVDAAKSSGGRLPRAVGAAAACLLAAASLWLALVLPNRPSTVSVGAFMRIPLEGLVLVAVALVVPVRVRRGIAVAFGGLAGALVVIKVLDLGFRAVLHRGFDPLNDWVYLGPGVGVLGDSIGHRVAVAIAIGAAAAAVFVLVLLPWSALRLTRVAAAHRTGSLRAVVTLAIAWVLAALTGLQLAPATDFASTATATLAYDEVQQVRFDIKDRGVFSRQIVADPYDQSDPNQLLRGLRGKDVLVVFVESYGRVAIHDSTFSPGVAAVLDHGTRRLHKVGFSARSGFLTSPTFGAGSWLAHSTLQSGLWVNSQQRYDQLLGTDRLTLTQAFGGAGWRTVLDAPADTEDWPQGQRFYHFDQVYDARNVGYEGPTFSYAPVPDQYTMGKFRDLELSDPSQPPVMAEIDLVSSHHPWTPLPHLVSWTALGDGSVYDTMPAEGESPEAAFEDPGQVRALYGQSIEYAWESLISFVETSPDPNLVMIVLGDHQPHSYVTGSNPGRDVPISVIAQDPDVMRQISGWGWQRGLRPAPDAPVSSMNTFRDRFLTAFAGDSAGR